MESTRLTLCMFLLGMSSSRAAVMVVDMTYDLGKDTVYWPGAPPFNFTILNRGLQAGGYWYETNSFATAEHGGTHVDAPAHFSNGSWRAEQIPAGKLVGPAVVVDIKSKAEADADYQLSVADLQDWERMHGRIPDNAIVIMNSGWGTRYPNTLKVFNTASPTDPSTFHFPGIHPDASTFLVTLRNVIAVGVDTPSTDNGQSKTYGTHVILGRHNILGLENLANVNDLPSIGATVVIGLVKLRDGSGGPARILGIVGDWDSSGAGGVREAQIHVWSFSWAVFLCCLLITAY